MSQQFGDNRYVTSVDCIALEKRLQPSKHYVYVFLVSWSDNVKHPIYRTYPSFFDLKSQLREDFPDKEDVLPSLPAMKYFEKTKLFGFRDASNEKKKKEIEEFCQKIIQLSADISRSATVLSFFETWYSDFAQLPPTSIKGLAGKKETSKHEDVCVKQQRTNSTSIGNNFSYDASGYVDVEITEKQKPKKSESVDTCVYATVSSIKGSPETGGGARQQEEAGGDSNQLYRAICNHKGTRPGDISFTKGAIVEVQERSFSGWWFVTSESGDSQGWAPGAFLEALVEGTNSPLSPGQEQEEVRGTYQAVADYTAVNYDEVSYKTGDLVEVIESSLDGWWRVRCHGKEGLSPAMHLEKKDQTEQKKRSFFYKKSMKRRGLPPRKSMTKVEKEARKTPQMPVYAQVKKPKSPPDGNNNGRKSPILNYTEICFDDSSKNNSPVIKKDVGVTYSDVLVISKQSEQLALTPSPHSPKLRSKSGGHSPKASPISGLHSPKLAPKDYPEQQERPSLKTYENFPQAKLQRYENLDIPIASVISPSKDLDSPVPYSRSPQDGSLLSPEVPARKPGPAKIFKAVSTEHPEIATEERKKVQSLQAGEDGDSWLPCADTIKLSRQKVQGQAWFAGVMSRVDAEALLSSANHQEFLIRESTNRVGDFTLSVQFHGKVRHFPIKLTQGNKYFIGKHNFKDMNRVVQYYQAHPLFYDDDGNSVSLGQPVPLPH